MNVSKTIFEKSSVTTQDTINKKQKLDWQNGRLNDSSQIYDSIDIEKNEERNAQLTYGSEIPVSVNSPKFKSEQPPFARHSQI